MRFHALLLFSVLAASAQTPNADDVVWQNAVHKFDAARAALLGQVDAGGQNGPFRPNWDSLKHYQVPAWYQDAKFGIFLHWGVYLRAGVRQRMVPAEYVPAGDAGVRP